MSVMTTETAARLRARLGLAQLEAERDAARNQAIAGIGTNLLQAAQTGIGAYSDAQRREQDLAFERQRMDQQKALKDEELALERRRLDIMESRDREKASASKAAAGEKRAATRAKLTGDSVMSEAEAVTDRAAKRVVMVGRMTPDRLQRVLDEEAARVAAVHGTDPATARQRVFARVEALQKAESDLETAQSKDAAGLALTGAKTRKLGVEADLKQAELDYLPEARRLDALARKARSDETAAKRARDERAAATAERQARAAEAQLEALLRKNRREEQIDERGRKPSTSEVQGFREQADVIGRLDRLTSELKEKGYNTGWFSDLSNTMAQKVGWDDPEFSAWKSRANDMLAAYIHSKSGAAASDKERAFLMQAVPTASDDQDTFLAKAKALRSHVSGNLDQAIRDLKAAGVDTSSFDRPDGKTSGPTVRVRLGNGKTGTIPVEKLEEYRVKYGAEVIP